MKHKMYMKQIIIAAAAIMTLLSCGGQKENKETGSSWAGSSGGRAGWYQAFRMALGVCLMGQSTQALGS